ncbi:MAG: MFS transporter [Bdellovibrionales bacterium]|nr:MFS transporter [Bdellovibrionales bacterium]
MNAFLHSRLAPFKHSSFRRYFLVQTLSMIGTWSHDLARAWIVVEMMGKAAALGLLMLSVALPTFVLILQGGVLVDKLEVRKLMMVTRATLACSAIALAALTEFGTIQLWHLLAFGLLEGSLMAFDSPAEQAMRVRLVPRDDFQQAIALMSSNFHLARMMGPLIAGLLMAQHGPSLVFLVDGISYLGVLMILSRLQLQPILRRPPAPTQTHAGALVEGLRYLIRTPHLRYPMFQLLLTICLIFPQIVVIFRTYVREKFHLSSGEFGYVFSLPAMGALAGALTYALWKPKTPIHTLRLSIPCLLVGYTLVPLMPTVEATAGVMMFTGFFSYLTFASLTITMHLKVEEDFRGRIGSIIGLGFLAIGPIMSFPVGGLADRIGFTPAVWALTWSFGLLSALLALLHWWTLKDRTRYKEKT